jgi:pteridine reductase
VGAGIALELARAGFDLRVTWRTDEAGAKATAQQAQALGASCQLLRMDLAAFGGRELPEALRNGPIDALVVSAAEWSASSWGEIALDAAMRLMRVNAVAPVLLVQALARRLSESRLPGGGSVVMVGDAHAHGTPVRGYGAYLMSKAALHQAVQQMAAEMAPKVRVNAVLPGVVAWPDDMPAASREAILARVPLARSGAPSDVGSLVRFLCLEAPFMTGALLPVDGGRSIR